MEDGGRAPSCSPCPPPSIPTLHTVKGAKAFFNGSAHRVVSGKQLTFGEPRVSYLLGRNMPSTQQGKTEVSYG